MILNFSSEPLAHWLYYLMLQFQCQRGSYCWWQHQSPAFVHFPLFNLELIFWLFAKRNEGKWKSPVILGLTFSAIQIQIPNNEQDMIFVFFKKNQTRNLFLFVLYNITFEGRRNPSLQRNRLIKRRKLVKEKKQHFYWWPKYY